MFFEIVKQLESKNFIHSFIHSTNKFIFTMVCDPDMMALTTYFNDDVITVVSHYIGHNYAKNMRTLTASKKNYESQWWMHFFVSPILVFIISCLCFCILIGIQNDHNNTLLCRDKVKNYEPSQPAQANVVNMTNNTIQLQYYAFSDGHKQEQLDIYRCQLTIHPQYISPGLNQNVMIHYAILNSSNCAFERQDPKYVCNTILSGFDRLFLGLITMVATFIVLVMIYVPIQARFQMSKRDYEECLEWWKSCS